MGFQELRFGATRVVFTDRHGGVSDPPYDTANLGLLTDDDRARVQDNRRRVGAAIGGSVGDPDRWFRIQQVHGAVVADADAGAAGLPEADGAVTSAAGLPLIVLTADCAAVALVAGGGLGVVHAGWRGLAAGVVEATVEALRARGTGPVRAVLGPCVHPARYRFGREDLERVTRRLGASVEARTADGELALDLRAGVRAALTGAEVTDLTDVDVCTASSPDHFSHRRDGPTGRQALIAVREP